MNTLLHQTLILARQATTDKLVSRDDTASLGARAALITIRARLVREMRGRDGRLPTTPVRSR